MTLFIVIVAAAVKPPVLVNSTLRIPNHLIIGLIHWDSGVYNSIPVDRDDVTYFTSAAMMILHKIGFKTE